MRITLTEQGGWSAGIPPREQVIDLDAIDANSAGEGRELVERLLASPRMPQTESPHARDDMEFSISVQSPSVSQVFKAKSLTLTPEFAALLAWLKRRLTEQSRQKGDEL